MKITFPFKLIRGIQWRHWPVFVFSLLFFSMASLAKDGVDTELPPGHYCYLRCLAKCVDKEGASALHSICKTKCNSYSDETLCNKTDTPCWSTCRDLISETNGQKPQPPRNVSVSYTRFPQPSPYEADVRWSVDISQSLYIIQYMDSTDPFQTWAKGGLGMNETTANRWHFVKFLLCAEYSFRVASVNRFGVSRFSQIVTLPEPVPVVPSPFYDLVSAELIDEPFLVNQADDSDGRRWNQTVRAVLTFAPPPNWNLETDIVDVTAEFYPEASGARTFGYSPQKQWIKGTSDFELRMPGGMGENLNYKLIFSVDKIITKCQTNDSSNIGYHYPTMVSNSRRHMMLPVYEFELNCRNIRHSSCPFDNRELLPSCGVRTIHVQKSINNQTSLVDANVTFDRLIEKRFQSPLHYLIAYGEGDSTSPDNIEMLPPSLIAMVSHFQLQNSTTQFHLSNLHPGKLYVVYICGIYTEGLDQVDWNMTSRYVIDLTDMEEEQEVNSGTTDQSSIALLVAPTTIAALIALLVCAIILRKHLQRRRDNCASRIDSSVAITDNRYVDQPRRFDKWEIPRRRLIINKDEKLGSGAFGAVYKGRVTGELLAHECSHLQSTEERMRVENCVAIKMLPEYADEKSKSDFRSEINLMKQLGYHERLVNMLGCVTGDDPLCLIVEYCPNGDLLRYLRVRKSYTLNLERLGVDLNNPGLDVVIDQNMLLSLKDVISFAWQISIGMEYISQKGYIHRDLAARNVLVETGKRVKIGDFGLCRYASKDPIYMGRGGRLPIKWMALEALKSYEFTTKSDVWSFGILVYELFTLGNTPYPGLDPCDIERFLDSGRRMAQPPQCPLDLYMIMLACWQEFPESRPTFTEIRERILLMLENLAKDYYYMQVLPYAGAETSRKAGGQEKSDQWPAIDDADMDDQVFENEPGPSTSKSETFSTSPIPPPLPPRPSKSRSSATSTTDENVPPFSPTRRTQFRESNANGEPVLVNEAKSESGSVKLRYIAKYTPSVDLTTVPEKEQTSASSNGKDRGSIDSVSEKPQAELQVRRRSSTVSIQNSH